VDECKPLPMDTSTELKLKSAETRTLTSVRLRKLLQWCISGMYSTGFPKSRSVCTLV